MRVYAALFVIGLAVYGAVAWDRVGRQSGAPHFVYQADAWLAGRASIAPPAKGDDWAKVETVVLDDGTEAEGRRLKTRPMFKLLDGTELPLARVRQSTAQTLYTSFPPFPAALMIPSAVIQGRNGNDVIPTLLIAALILPLLLLVLRRLADAGLSKRSVRDDLWLVALLAFGSVLFFSAVQGKVWYTAHVVGVALALAYAWASIEARHPVLAGLALGAAALTRTPMAFMFPLFVLEAWRMASRVVAAEGEEAPPEAGASGSLNLRAGKLAVRKRLVRPLLQFAAPIVGFAIAGMIFNYVRFGSFTEFGHSYLDVRQQVQIEQYGLASYHYLGRNLAVALTLLPEALPREPWVQISGHGLAMWVTTPLLLYVLWPRDKNVMHRALWITVAAVALPSLFYQNSGWFQFGYRFSLDYLVFLVMLIAIGGRPLRGFARTLIVVGVVINLFGAVTFDRYWKFYRGGGNAYDVVVSH
ncbi:MAG: hypothetical protein H0T42_09190 [Deltaproteobacteria bacterium]|nr:hypothetical protein [Deltaproteobacteria bacterium]